MSHYGPAATHGRGARASGNNHRHPSMGIGRGSIQMPRHLHRQMMPPPPPPPPPPPRPRGALPHSQLQVGSGIHKEFMMVRPHANMNSNFLPPPPPPPPPRGTSINFGNISRNPNQPSSTPQTHQRVPIGVQQPSIPMTWRVGQGQQHPVVIQAPLQSQLHTQSVPTVPKSHIHPPSTSSQPPNQPTSAGWEQHTYEGKAFYYNAITKVSTYERPACLGLIPASNQTANISSTTNNATSVMQQQKQTTWKTYTDKSSGKLYYSNGVTTTWTRPADLAEEQPPVKAQTVTTSKKRKKSSQSDKNVCTYASKSEAIAAFKGLLLAKNITPNNNWNEVHKLCTDDPRWEALSTIGERRQALAEYQTKRSNELKDVKRLEVARGKEAFNRMLSDLLTETFDPTMRYANIRELLANDDRFHALQDEATREELFYDFVEESRKREERSRRIKKRDVKESFLGILKSYEEQGKLTFASTWSSFVSQLNEDEKNDPSFVVSQNMSDSDRQLFFADYVIQLQTLEDEKQHRILEANQRAEKAQRHAYRDRLREMAEAGSIRPDTRWRDVQVQLARHSTYDPVYAQRRDAPRELFEDFVEEWSEEFRRERAVLNRALGLDKVKFDEALSLEEFRQHLLKVASPVPDLYAEVRRILSKEDKLSSCCLLYEERVTRHSNNNDIEGDCSSEDEGEIIEDL